MRKFFTALAAAAALFCVSSCNLSSLQDYAFSYQVLYELSSEEKKTAIEDYFGDFIDTHSNFVRRGEYSEAWNMGAEQFAKDIQTIDEALILSILDDENDIVQLMLNMTGDKTNVPVAYVRWQGKPEGGDDDL